MNFADTTNNQSTNQPTNQPTSQPKQNKTNRTKQNKTNHKQNKKQKKKKHLNPNRHNLVQKFRELDLKDEALETLFEQRHVVDA